VPTKELIEQTYKFLCKFEKYFSFNCKIITSNINIKSNEKIDFIISTPGKLLGLLKKKEINFISLKHFIIGKNN
jgi:superfamily II DNA/RNA helicase